ncbi:hypothetical protein [Streptomyces sp. NPDC001480]|uniref:hypothetical protein n=1 Tax=Streptomyces sp. NPDC001480 TaxID=3364577 RepID=UPI00368AACE0
MRAAYTLVRHEARLLASLALWPARRRPGAAAGQVFGYAQGQGATMAGLAFVCVIETFMMSVLLRRWPIPHGVVLALDVYTVVFVVALHAACVVHPHVLTADTLRVRHGVHVDLRIPLETITAVRREVRFTQERAPGRLDVAVGSRTSVTLELAQPVRHMTLLGRRREVTEVRLHADDADALVRALTRADRRAGRA